MNTTDTTPAASQHTPEHKAVTWNPGGSGESYGVTINEVSLISCASRELADKVANSMNACAGMADPAAEIAKLREQRDELADALKYCAACLSDIPAFGDSIGPITTKPMLAMACKSARAALAKLEAGK